MPLRIKPKAGHPLSRIRQKSPHFLSRLKNYYILCGQYKIIAIHPQIYAVSSPIPA